MNKMSTDMGQIWPIGHYLPITTKGDAVAWGAAAPLMEAHSCLPLRVMMAELYCHPAATT